MNICITDASAKSFMGLFNSVIPTILSDNNLTAEEVVSKLYETTFEQLSKDVDPIKLKEVLIQHLGIGVTAAVSHIGSNPVLSVNTYAKGLTEMQTKIAELALGEKSDFQKLFNLIGSIVDSGDVVIPEQEPIRFNAVSLELARTTNQLSIFDNKGLGFKGNVTREEMLLHEKAIVQIIESLEGTYEFKLVKGSDIANDPNYIGIQDIAPDDFVLVPYSNKKISTFEGFTPVFTFKQNQNQLNFSAKTIIDQKYRWEKLQGRNPNKKAIEQEVQKSISIYLGTIADAKAAYNSGREVFFEINQARSNKGFIEQNRNKVTYANTISNVNKNNVEKIKINKQTVYRLNVGAKNTVMLREKSWMSEPVEIFERLLHLLKTENPTFITKQADGTETVWNENTASRERLKEIKRFFPTYGKTVSSNLNVINLTEGYVVLNNRKINISDLTLEDLINASKYRGLDKKVPYSEIQNNSNVEILNSADEVTETGQWYFNKSGVVYEVVGPQKAYGSVSEIESSVRKIESFVDGKIYMNDPVTNPYTFGQEVLDNSFVVVELNAQGELKGGGLYLSFVPSVTEEIIANEAFKFFTQEVAETLASPYENEIALSWFKNNPLSQVIQLIMHKEHSDKGPQYLASFIGNVINMYKGAEGVLLYHEAFHAFWTGIVPESKRKEIEGSLRSKPGSFTVTINGVKKTVSFAEATSLELEEYLAEEFRSYATNEKSEAAESNSSIKEFFAKILKAITDLFKGVSYGDFVSLGKSQIMVNALFKDLYSGNFDVSSFNVETSVGEKYASFENKTASFSIADTNLILESMNSLTSLMMSEAFSYHNSFENISKALTVLDEMVGTNINTPKYEELEKKLKSFNGNVPIGKGYEKLANPNVLRVVLTFVNKAFTDKLEVLKRDLKANPNNATLIYQVELLEKMLQPSVFGDTSKISEYLNEDVKTPSTIISLFLKKNSFLQLVNVDASDLAGERILVSEEQKIEDEIATEVFIAGADMYNSTVDALDTVEQKTKILLSSIPEHNNQGLGSIKVNSLGFPKVRTLGYMHYKIMSLLHNSTSAEEMNSRLKAAAVKDKEISHMYNLLGDLMTPEANQELWLDFHQTFDKYYTKSETVIVTKRNEFAYDENAEVKYDDEGNEIDKKQVLKSSSLSIYSGSIGQDSQAVKQQWVATFDYLLESGSPYIGKDELGKPYLNLQLLLDYFTKPSDKRHVPNNYTGNPEDLLVTNQMVNKSNYSFQPKAVHSPFEFLEKMGITVIEDPRVHQAFINGDSQLKLESGIMGHFLTHLQNRLNKVITLSDRRVIADPNAQRIYKLDDLFSKFNYKTPLGETKLSNQTNTLTNLMKLHYAYSNEAGTFMAFDANGNKSNQMSYHSSLNNMVAVINSADTYDELISIPGFEHLDLARNVQAQTYVWLKAMFNLHNVNSDNYGVRNKTVSIQVKALYGSKLIEEDVDAKGNVVANDIGTTVRDSDETTKYLSDIELTLSNKQETPRAEAKSTSLTVSGYIYKRSTQELRGGQRLVFNFSEGKELELDDYSGQHMTDLFIDTLASELLRINEIKNLKSEKDLIFDSAYLNRASKLQFFDDIFEDNNNGLGFIEKVKALNIKSLSDLETAFSNDPLLQQSFEKGLVNYFVKRRDNLLKNKSNVEYPQELLDKAKLVEGETNQELLNRLLLTFTINNTVNNLNYSSLFLLDFANYNVEGEDFHKRIAGLISTGKGFRFDEMWINHISKDAYLTAQEFAKREGIEIPKENTTYDGSIKTAVIKEKKTSSIYSKLYSEYVGINISEYEKMKEADGQGWISFDMYRILSRSSNEWSDAQENLYQKIAKGETVSNEDVKTTFPVRKFQYYGPIQGASESVRLALTAFHKYSLAPLVPSVIKGTKLEKLHNSMMKQGIGYVTMESGSKLATLAPVAYKDGVWSSEVDTFYNENRSLNEGLMFTPNILHVRYLKNQLFLAEGYKGRVTLPTQIQKIIMSGMFDNGIPTDYITTKENRKESWTSLSEIEKRAESKHYDWYVRYQELMGVDSQGNYGKIPSFLRNQLENDLGLTLNTETGLYEGDDAKLISYIKVMLENKELLEEEIASLLDLNTGNLISDLSFSLHASAIEKLLTVLVDKRLRKLKINGESLVQVSGTMYEGYGIEEVIDTEGNVRYGSNQLRFYHPLDENGNPITESKDFDKVAAISSMEVIVSLQGSYKSLLYLEHSDGKKIAVMKDNVLDYEASLTRLNEMMDLESFRKENENVLTMVGVRIPTQSANSLSIPTIRKFLPEYAGPVIILPSEIVAQAGSDFDIDKLFSMMKHIKIYNKKAESVKFMESARTMEELDSLIETEQSLLKIANTEVQDAWKEYIDYLKEKDEFNQNIEPLWSKIKDLSKDIDDLYELKSNVFNDKNLLYSERKNIHIDIQERIDEKKQEVKTLISFIESEVSNFFNTEIKNKKDREEVVQKNYEKFMEVIAEKQKAENIIQEKINNYRREIDGQSIKGLENELIDLYIERGLMVSNFKGLVTANTTEDAKFMADTILAERTENPLDGEYNKRLKLHSNSPTISRTEIMMYEYNLYKHQENFVGMDSLGIAAVVSTFQALFTVSDGVLQQNESDSDSAFLKAKTLLKNYASAPQENKVNFNQAQLITAKETIANYLSKKIMLTSNVNAEGNHYLGGLFSAGENKQEISDIISQLINGYVDVAKDAWIFMIEGNKENTPILLAMIMLGVPLNDAVRMSTHPVVRKYTSLKKAYKGPFSNINDEVSIVPSGLVKTRALQSMEILKNRFFPGMTFNEIYNMIDTPFTSEELNSSSTKKLNELTARDIEIFAQYLHIEKLADEMTTVTGLTKYDTTKLSTVNDVKKRIEDTAEYKKKPVSSKMLGNHFIDYLQKSIVGSRNNDEFMAHLFDKQFGVRNSSVLTELSLRIKRKDIPKNFDLDTVRTHFKNDFILFLYQNAVYSGDSLTIADSMSGKLDNYVYKQHQSSEIKIEDGVIYYNPKSSFLSEISKEEYKYVKKYFKNINQIKNLIHYRLTYEMLERNTKDLTEQEFMDTYFLFDKRGNSYKGRFSSFEAYRLFILQRAALVMSSNPETLFDSELGIVPLILNLKDKHPDLNNYGIVSNMRWTSNNELSKYNINYPNLNTETELLKEYRENLKHLSNHSSEWVRFIFNTDYFSHLGIMQTGLSRNVKNDFARIGNERLIQDTLLNTDVSNKIKATLKQAEILQKNSEGKRSTEDYLILSQYFNFFKNLLSTGQYKNRYSGINYTLSELDFVTTVNELGETLDVKALFVPENKATVTAADFRNAENLEEFVRELSEMGAANLLLPNTRILMMDTASQAFLDRYMNQYLNIDNTKSVPVTIKRSKLKKTSGIDLAPIIDSVKTSNSSQRYTLMASNSNKIYGVKVKPLSTGYSSSVSNLIDALKGDSIYQSIFNQDTFSENDNVWVFGDSVIDKAYSGYTLKEYEKNIDASFNELVPVLDKMIQAGASILVSPLNGVDQKVRDYLLSNSYVSLTVYENGQKYFKFVPFSKADKFYETSPIVSESILGVIVSNMRKDEVLKENLKSGTTESKISVLRQAFTKYVSESNMPIQNGQTYANRVRAEISRLGDFVEIGMGDFNILFEQMLSQYSKELKSIIAENKDKPTSFGKGLSNSEVKTITFDELNEFTAAEKESIVKNLMMKYSDKYKTVDSTIEAINNSLSKGFNETITVLNKNKC